MGIVAWFTILVMCLIFAAVLHFATSMNSLVAFLLALLIVSGLLIYGIKLLKGNGNGNR